MTIINNSGPNTTAGVLAQQFAKRAAQQPANPQAASPATASPTATQPDKADPYAALREFVNKWKDSQQAISRMSNAGSDISQARKAAAAEMVRRIKEQLKIMMSMMASMNPKAKAQLIAQMSRDLAAAAREYAAASGGGGAQAGVEVTISDSGGVQNDSAASSGGEQSATADAASATSDAAASTDVAPEAGAESAAAAAAAASPTPAASPADSTGTPQQIGEAVRGKLAEYAQNSASPDSKADQEFVMEVRRLAAMLKALAKQSEVHAPKNPEKSTEREMANINDALKEVERSLASIESPSSAVTVSISVVAK